MRPLSFRAQLLLLMVTPVLVTTAVLGWLAYQAASEALGQGAIRAVGMAADAREQALVMRLRRQQERAQSFLKYAASDCEEREGVTRVRCLEQRLGDFVLTEGVRGALLTVPGLEPIPAGEWPPALEDVHPLPSGQLARFESRRDGARVYAMLVQEGGMRLGLRFDVSVLQALFQERHGLGKSGETFLADSQGVFITAPKYPGRPGEMHSHPLDDRPMRECLSGRDAEFLALDYRGIGVIHGFRFIEEVGGGCVMAHIEQAEAFAPARALRTRVAQAAAILSVLAVGLSFLFARGLSRPVGRLTERARALQAGDFDLVVPVEGPRELKTFADTFTTMARSLRESAEERARLLARETEARREAEEQKTLLRLIIEQSGDAIMMADEWGVLRVFNPVAERQHGVSQREIGASEWSYGLFSLEGRPLALEEAPLYRAVQGEVVANARWQVRCPDGSPRTLEGTATPLRKPDGAPAGGVLIARDITRQHEAELERERLLRELEAERTRLGEAVRIRDDLVAVVSHDLRNPISAISMSASTLLKRHDLEDWQAKGLGRIYSSADRALRMIRDLLDSTQARVGTIPVRPGPLDFHGLTRHVVEEVQLAHPERHIVFQPHGDGRGAWDADRMAQVITNLVGNAVQHSPAGTPVRVCSRGGDGEVLLEVHNAGPPIPTGELPTLFEPFRRGRSAGGQVGSVGLGLFISRRLVEAHGGTIGVRSEEGEGTTFTVRLPRVPPSEATAP